MKKENIENSTLPGHDKPFTIYESQEARNKCLRNSANKHVSMHRTENRDSKKNTKITKIYEEQKDVECKDRAPSNGYEIKNVIKLSGRGERER